MEDDIELDDGNFSAADSDARPLQEGAMANIASPFDSSLAISAGAVQYLPSFQVQPTSVIVTPCLPPPHPTLLRTITRSDAANQ